jgi:hypothetical protein
MRYWDDLTREEQEALAAVCIIERILHEVDRPALIDALRDRHRRPGAEGALATTAFAYAEPLLFVEPVDLLQVQPQPVALEHHGQPAVANYGRRTLVRVKHVGWRAALLNRCTWQESCSSFAEHIARRDRVPRWSNYEPTDFKGVADC